MALPWRRKKVWLMPLGNVAVGQRAAGQRGNRSATVGRLPDPKNNEMNLQTQTIWKRHGVGRKVTSSRIAFCKWLSLQLGHYTRAFRPGFFRYQLFLEGNLYCDGFFIPLEEQSRWAGSLLHTRPCTGNCADWLIFFSYHFERCHEKSRFSADPFTQNLQMNWNREWNSK